MEAAILLLVVVLFCSWVVFPLWAIIRIVRLTRQVEALQAVDRLAPIAPTRPTAVVPPPPTPEIVSPAAPLPPEKPVAPPPALFAPPSPPAPTPVAAPAPPSVAPPPPTPSAVPLVPVATSKPPAKPRARINWEQFMGVKLLAWLGGFAAFLGVAFGVKYSFEHDLVPPEVRAAMGFVLAVGMLVGGLRLPRPRFAVTAQTLCATGVVSLYAVTFACRSIYAFPFFGPLPTFGLMVLITATAFLLAVRLDARVVAILGILGGFLTPKLISTGQDNPLGLFAYLGLLNVGLLAVALRQSWGFLAPLGAVGTAVMQVGWASLFLHAHPPGVTVAVCLSMLGVYGGGAWLACRVGRVRGWIVGAALGLAFLALAFAGYLALQTPAGLSPWTALGFLFAADAVILLLGAVFAPASRWHFAGAAVVFGVLAAWLQARVTPAQLPGVWAAVLAFAALHGFGPLWLQRRHPEVNQGGVAPYVPALGLFLLLGPFLASTLYSPWLWPTVLLLDVVALAVAWVTLSVGGVLAVVALTLLTLARWFNVTPEGGSFGLGLMLGLTGGFAVVFTLVGLWWKRRHANGASVPGSAEPAWAVALLPISGAVLPFLLLVMVASRLPLPQPHALFGLTLILVVLTLGVARALASPWVSLCALLGSAATVFAWLKVQGLTTPVPGQAALWVVALASVQVLAPFLSPSTLRLPWLSAALAPVVLFQPLHALLIGRGLWSPDLAGLLPLAVGVLPAVALVARLRGAPAPEPVRLAQLASLAGSVLFFVTAVIPLQFERHWISIGWAWEGAALLWLYHRLPHRGLGWTGLGLLLTSFARLALNPEVLRYQTTGYAPILNWYLYTYGLVAAALLVAARLLAPPRDHWGWSDWPAKLRALAGVLLFLLLNLEIADFFAVPGQETLTFDFTGNLARDMSYTVGWALFAFGVLVLGVWRRSRGARFAALGLLGAALLKLFFHDLSHLGALYRIGALFAVAVIAMAASVVYQRFVPSHDKTPSPDA